MDRRDEDIERVVNEVIADRFAGSRIVSVDVQPDCDADGDPILRVRVVYDPDAGKLDVGRMSGLLRHLLSRLDELGESKFPVVSFISEQDARTLNPEAA